MKSIGEKIADGIQKFYTAFINQRVLTTSEEVQANTNEKNLASAVVVGEIYNNLMSVTDGGQIENFHIGEDGKPYITYKVGADAVTKKLGDLPDSFSFTIGACTDPRSSYAIYGVASVTIPTLGYKYMRRSDKPNEQIDISNESTVTISQSSGYAGSATSVTITFYNN